MVDLSIDTTRQARALLELENNEKRKVLPAVPFWKIAMSIAVKEEASHGAPLPESQAAEIVQASAAETAGAVLGINPSAQAQQPVPWWRALESSSAASSNPVVVVAGPGTHASVVAAGRKSLQSRMRAQEASAASLSQRIRQDLASFADAGGGRGSPPSLPNHASEPAFPVAATFRGGARRALGEKPPSFFPHVT
jgi:hypothetical protein